MVTQTDLQGNVLKKFNSISMASKILNIKRSIIVDCCKGKQKTFKGTIFKRDGI